MRYFSQVSVLPAVDDRQLGIVLIVKNFKKLNDFHTVYYLHP